LGQRRYNSDLDNSFHRRSIYLMEAFLLTTFFFIIGIAVAAIADIFDLGL
jgi:hypothetical protein